MIQAIATHEEHAIQTGVVLIPLNKLKKSPDKARKTRTPKPRSRRSPLPFMPRAFCKTWWSRAGGTLV